MGVSHSLFRLVGEWRLAAVDGDGTLGEGTVASRSGSDARGSGLIARRDVDASDGTDHLVGSCERGSELANRRWLLLKWIHDSI